MKFVAATILVIALAGCNGPYNLGPDALSSADGVGMEPMESKLNFSPGRYRDFADYSVAVDADLLKDVQAAGGDRDDAHCVAEKLGRRVHGSSDYEMLSAAVSGRAKMTVNDERRVQGQQDRFVSSTTSDPADARRLLENIMRDCLAT